MIYCYLCPLKDVCSIPKIKTEMPIGVSLPPPLPFTLNWLPNGNENECPLYKVAITNKK